MAPFGQTGESERSPEPGDAFASTSGTRCGNLPVFLTPFIGRSSETAAVGKLLESERLVSILGTGGAGKTRLSREVGVSLADKFECAYWVELAEITDSEIEDAVRSAFGISAASKFSLGETVRRIIDGSDCLLILDNAEHLVEAAARVVLELLEECRTLRVLTTSRVPLGVPSEVEWQLPPMSVEIQNSDAIILFVDRARKARPDFMAPVDEALDPEELSLVRLSRQKTMDAVVEICERLDGIPLAIELAAARCRLLTPNQILDGLDNALGLLSGGSPLVSARQQTLEASIQWSYDLLSEECQELLRMASVFRGGWTVQVLDELVGAGPVLNTLDELVQHSLVYVGSENLGPNGLPELRFSMLEMVRQFADARLEERPDEEQRVKSDYSHWYSHWLLGLEWDLFANDQGAWLPILTRERPNIIHAAGLLAATNDLDELCSIISGLQGFALLADWVGPIEHFLNLLEPYKADLNLDQRALIQWMSTMLSFCQGDIDAVIAGCDRLANGEDFRDHEAFSDRGRSVMLMMFGAAGLDVIDEMMELARSEPESDHPYWGRFTYVGVEGVAIHQGQLVKAREVGPLLDVRMEGANSMPLARMRDLYLGRLAFAEGDLLRSSKLLLKAAHSSSTALASRLMAIGYVGMVLSEIEPSAREKLGHRINWADLHELVRHAVEIEGNLMGEGFAIWLDVGELIFDGDIRRAVEPLRLVARNTTELGAAPVSYHEQYTLAAAGLLDPDSQDWLWTGSTYAEAAYQRAKAEVAFADNRLDEALEHAVSALRIELPQRADRGPCFSLETIARVLIFKSRCVEGLRLLGACDAYRARRFHRLAPCLSELREQSLKRARVCLAPTEYEAALVEGAKLSISEAAELSLRQRSKRGRPVSGWEALTPTEAKVADRVSSGMTNREVGADLLMSPETVKTHLSRVFTKLSVANRKELIVAFHRRDSSD